MNIFISTLLSFLPKRYRNAFTRFDVPCEGALVGGILEMLVSTGLLIRGYFAYMNERLASIPQAVYAGAGEKGGESAIMGLGPIVMLEYVIHVTTILLIFFLVEGAVRLIAAIGSRETVPSLPLYLLAKVHSKLDARQQEASMGARIADEVQSQQNGAWLQVSSCRPKAWNQLTTISHSGGLYEMYSQRQDEGSPRPFVYVLRRKPPTAVIRGICLYDPEEVLHPGK